VGLNIKINLYGNFDINIEIKNNYYNDDIVQPIPINYISTEILEENR